MSYRRLASALPPTLMLLFGAATTAPAVAGVVPARTACDATGRCYETGDPSPLDDIDRPAPRRRFDRDDDDPASSPMHRRFDRDDDD